MKPLLFWLVLIQLAGEVFGATVQDLRCERLKDPLGIDVTRPVLG